MKANTVPLSRLRLGDEAPQASINARTSGWNDEFDQLIASIRAAGLIQALTVRSGQDAGEDVFFVIDGNRRLAALREIAAQDGMDPATVTVPVLEREEETAEAAFEASLAANVVRTPLHPVDQYEAFARLAEQGMSEADIAARFAISAKGVRQRLALGKLSPKIRAAWRNGELGEHPADCAAAFTLCPDHKLQDQVYAKLSKGVRMWPHIIRHELGAGDRDCAVWLKIAGVDAYTAAGGQVTEDLFGDNHAVSDRDLLERMAEAKLEEIKSRLIAEGWSWAELAPDLPYHWSYNWEKLRVSKKKATAAQKAKSGCVIAVGMNGEINITYGVVKPAKTRKDAPAKAGKESAAEPSEPTISNAMMHRLSVSLTMAVQKSLPASPRIALAAIVAGLTCGGSAFGRPVQLRPEGLGRYEHDHDADGFAPTFARLKERSVDELLAALAVAMARTIDLQCPSVDRPPQSHEGFVELCDALDGEALTAALAETWIAEDYFAGISKPLVIRAIEESIGPDEARKAGSKKKKELTEFAVANVPQTGWLPPELRTAHYTPPRPGVAEAAE